MPGVENNNSSNSEVSDVEENSYIWDKVFKDEPSKIFKGCLPLIFLGLFLNSLSRMWVWR